MGLDFFENLAANDIMLKAPSWLFHLYKAMMFDLMASHLKGPGSHLHNLFNLF